MRCVIAGAALAALLPACIPAAKPVPVGETPQETIDRQARRIERLEADLAERDAQVKQLREQLAVAQGLRPEFADLAVEVERVILGRYSHVADFDPARPGPDGVKVYLFLNDRAGDKIKRAGRIELKALDLKDERKFGHWLFDPRQALDHWKSGLLLDGYVFELPWQEPPPEGLESVTLWWQFESLTGRRFSGSETLFFTQRASP